MECMIKMSVNALRHKLMVIYSVCVCYRHRAWWLMHVVLCEQSGANSSHPDENSDKQERLKALRVWWLYGVHGVFMLFMLCCALSQLFFSCWSLLTVAAFGTSFGTSSDRIIHGALTSVVWISKLKNYSRPQFNGTALWRKIDTMERLKRNEAHYLLYVIAWRVNKFKLENWFLFFFILPLFQPA